MPKGCSNRIEFLLCVAQFGQSTRFGTEKSLVQLQPHRPNGIFSVNGSIPGFQLGGVSSNLARYSKNGRIKNG